MDVREPFQTRGIMEGSEARRSIIDRNAAAGGGGNFSVWAAPVQSSAPEKTTTNK